MRVQQYEECREMIYPDGLDDFVWFDNALRQKDIQETKIMQEENVQETILNPFIFEVKGNGLSPDSFEDNSRQQRRTSGGGPWMTKRKLFNI